MHDLEDDPDSPSNYECLACGEIVTAEDRPDQCPNCEREGAFQNRAYSLE